MVERTGPQEPRVRLRLLVTGTVQGVGFRPFVFHLAGKYGLGGTVLNTGAGVAIEVEGPAGRVQSFCRELCLHPPRLARIESLKACLLPAQGDRLFTIADSRTGTEREVSVPPDVALCPDCRREVFDPRDRHYLYPFTNCTNCGPRFTIVRDVPYDRSRTSMAGFAMCPECRREYEDPADRRFHAQPVACPRCGPQVELVDGRGRRVAGPDDWREATWERLLAGAIVAVKGLGGFHLACNAADPAPVALLRRRKGRDHKPFAVMARDLETVRRCCLVNETEERLLTSPAAPIVVLERRPDWPLPEELAPNLRTLGVMLPYTPLHCLLLEGPLELLVMTSANRSELPLIKDNREVLEQLAEVVDFVLWHDRPIVNRCDDSVVMVVGDAPRFIRRSRGYVPEGITVPRFSEKAVLGIGGEMKNAFCLLKGEKAFFSQHLGEMEYVEGQEFLLEALERWQRILDVSVQVIGFDLHPNYATRLLAREIAAEARVGVQHHHAHLASCLAENGETGPALGLILDGTGYGTDGNLWGFEVISGDYRGFSRHYHLRYLPLPGGEVAVRHPWRTAVALLSRWLGDAGEDLAYRLWGRTRGRDLETVLNLIRAGVNCPLACGCGRLFDAVAALLGLGETSTYEGQLAAELSELVPSGAQSEPLEPYPYSFAGEELDLEPTVSALWEDYRAGTEKAKVAKRFHDTLVCLLVEAAERARQETGLHKVALSGGTWQNRYLLSRVEAELANHGFAVLTHRLVPANDGGLALGQALVADRRWRECA
ncbi:MAG: carbamoyltransferase HypF [Clostridia bacterium]|nr:carbamoyltransferase HypF [Clostridia bacterium]MDH7573868.1 carbamoyltransferase HypF [Clostridia bacterium]